MSFISKNVFRGAGFLIAAQVFLAFTLTGDDLLDKLKYVAGLTLFPIPLLLIGAVTSTENGVRAAGFTILFWAIAGAVALFGAVYGDPNVDQIPGVRIPEPSQLSLSFGIGNLVFMLLSGLGVWLWGLVNEPAPDKYHTIG